MIVNRALADCELQRDFLVGEPCGNQFDNFQFPLREIGAPWAALPISRPRLARPSHRCLLVWGLVLATGRGDR